MPGGLFHARTTPAGPRWSAPGGPTSTGARIATLSAAVFFSGLFFAPTMIVVMGLVEKTVPPAALTEGMTWAITGLSVGVALGSSVSGGMVDRSGGFAVGIAAGGATVLLAPTAQGPLNRSLRARAVERPADEGRAKSVL